MSDLAGLLEVIANNTVTEVRLQPETLAVLLYALDKIRNPLEWSDYWGEYIPDADKELIHELVDLAADDIMRPIVMIPVGATMMWHMVAPPDRWLFCNGGMVAKADYPELWALWGDTFGASTTDLFKLINMTDRSPWGQSGFLGLNATAGASTHTLTEAQIPSHTHPFERRTTNGAGATFAALGGQVALATDGITKSTGGGQSHNNLHPVIGVNYIVYAGKQA